MTDPHAKAVEAAALALINQDRARFELPPHAASSEAFDEGRKATGIATTAITAFLAAMRAEGWVMVPRDATVEMENACIRASLAYLALHALKSIWPWHNRRHVRGNIQAGYRAMIEAAMLKGAGDE